MPARIARVSVALATAAAVWCLESAHLLSPRAALVVITLLLLAETYAALWPAAARRIALPAGVAVFGLIAVERLHQVTVTDISSARPLGAFLTAGAMVVLALVGGQRRDLFARMGLLVAAAGLALTADAGNAVIPAISVAVATGAAMVALERTMLVSAPNAAQSRRPPPPFARTRLVAVPVAATVALAAFVASNASLPKHQPHATVGAPTGFEGSFSEGPSAQTRLSPGSATMDLRQRGALSDQPVARIEPFGDDSPHLWRAAVMDGYDGTRWYVDNQSEPVAASGAQLVDQVIPVGSYQFPLLTPGTATRVALPGETADDPSFPETIVGGRYQVASVVPVASPERLAATPVAADPDEEGPVNTPPVPARVLALAQQLTAHAATRQQAVNAVVAYLHSHETYKLDSPVPAKGADAVDDFLFRTHTGFCEQFASAAAILLQASSVPTRVVTGYASGQRQPDGSWLLRGSDAHAWIEVEYPGVGWVPVDPTAGVRLAASGSSWHWQPLAIVGSLLLLAALAFAGVRAARRRRALHADPLRHSLIVLDAALGSARRRPTESLRDLAARVPLSPVERRALNTAERVFYGASPVDAGDIHSAAATMRRTAWRVRRERLVPRRRRSIR